MNPPSEHKPSCNSGRFVESFVAFLVNREYDNILQRDSVVF